MSTLEQHREQPPLSSSELIGLAYEAAAEPSRWPFCFAALAASVGHHASNLVIHGFGPTRYVCLDTPGGGFESINPSRVFANKALSRRNFTIAYVGGEIVEEWSQARSERALATGIRVFADETRSLDAADRALLRNVLPHLHRAFVLHFRHDTLQNEHDTLSTCLDEFSTGMVLLDSNARVLHANKAALDYLNGPYGLVCENGQLSPRGRDVEASFHRNLENAMSGRRGTMAGQPLPCGATLWFRGLSGDRAVAYITGERRARSLAPELLTEAFQLSPAQARVGSLFASGNTVSEIASQLAISVHTVRLHVKTIQRKTGTHRQATLVRRVLETIPKVNL